MTNPIDPKPGETWRCRGGSVAVITVANDPPYPIRGRVDGGYWLWSAEGKIAPSEGEHPLDLISRVTPAPEQPAVTPPEPVAMPEPVATLRDQFAMAIAPAFLAKFAGSGSSPDGFAEVACVSYIFADAMIAAGKQQP